MLLVVASLLVLQVHACLVTASFASLLQVVGVLAHLGRLIGRKALLRRLSSKLLLLLLLLIVTVAA